MKLEGTLPIPTLTATLGPAIGKAWRTVRIDGARKRGPGRGRGVRICTRCRGKGHQRNSFDCPARPAP